MRTSPVLVRSSSTRLFFQALLDFSFKHPDSPLRLFPHETLLVPFRPPFHLFFVDFLLRGRFPFPFFLNPSGEFLIGVKPAHLSPLAPCFLYFSLSHVSLPLHTSAIVLQTKYVGRRSVCLVFFFVCGPDFFGAQFDVAPIVLVVFPPPLPVSPRCFPLLALAGS